ncbi:hypothetical protein W97_03471 [Coniosporium apollinis CBS 100218]|uniref:Zinc/iron permease n=1 Tax=Coniosporium apollinis (strain CBS 100218) TaxID=1168221 RepID=R7YQP1_CONA1|nr:uncharacterized protein W97_03471 [Coniosporium apollinis CBS 100218]EON64240.1 hypothetical protein W97_03471 [Coniosporium apollinis CBS 100218]
MSTRDGELPSTGHPASWVEIPTALLRAELLRREDSPDRQTCGSKDGKASYNTPLHFAALVIILVLSTFACSFPIIVRRFPRLPVPHHLLFLSRHFGTGVLIATAFVHLLPTAFVSLTDPCLPPFWNQGYPAMAGLIAMTSVLIVVGVEMFFATKGGGHVHGSDFDTPLEEGTHNHGPQPIALGEISIPAANYSDEITPAAPTQHPRNKSKTRTDSDSDSSSDLDLSDAELETQRASRALMNDHLRGQLSNHGSGSLTPSSPRSPLPAAHTHMLTDDEKQKKLLLQCLLLEAGILFHSIFIGMALSVATGTPFIVLLIAISFHQTFEGLALGSRISALSFPANSPKPWLMALAYGTTTPIGQALGLAIHTLYDPQSQTGLLTVGVMNAVSSGLLLFAGLVELLAEDFLSDESYVKLRGRKRMEACGAVVGGAALMALVGAWA